MENVEKRRRNGAAAECARNRWKDAGYRERQLKYLQDPVRLKEQAEVMKRNWKLIWSSSESRKKRSEKCKERWRNKEFKERVRKKIRKSLLRPENVRKMSLLCTKNNADLSTGFGKSRGSPDVYNGIRMRSKFEVLFAEKLDKAGIKWKYEIKTFLYDMIRRYTPDFFLCKTKEFVELKPSIYVTKAVHKKLHIVRDQGFVINLVTERNLVNFIEKRRTKCRQNAGTLSSKKP